MRRTLLILGACAALSCSPDAPMPLAPETPLLSVAAGAGIRGQLAVRYPAATIQYRFAVTEAGGSITKVHRPKVGSTVTTVLPVLDVCTWEGAAGRSVRMVTHEDEYSLRDFWIVRTQEGRGPAFHIVQLTRQQGAPPLDPEGHPCNPYYETMAFQWTAVSGAVHLGL